MNLWWYFLGWLFSENYAVRHLKELHFHYVSHPFTPDEVVVWRGNTYLFSYAWIDGVEAHPRSALGRIHAAWKDEQDGH